MRRWHRRALVGGAVLAAGAAGFSYNAQAFLGFGDIVECTNCSDAWTQITQLAKETESAATQAQAYVRQGMQYANQLQNTIALPMQVWGSTQSDISTVRSIATAGSQLSGAGGLNGMIGSASAIGGQLNNIATMPGRYATWGTMEKDSLTSTLKTLGVTQDQRKADAAMLSVIQGQSATATGQVQAIQAGNELASQQVVQTQKLQEIAAAQLQLDANHMAIADDRQAVADTAMTKFISAPNLSMTSGARY